MHQTQKRNTVCHQQRHRWDMPEGIKWFTTAGTTDEKTVTIGGNREVWHEGASGPMKRDFVTTLEWDYAVPLANSSN